MNYSLLKFESMWFIYIILCDDNSLYTGSTNDLSKRFEAHITGKGSKYTRSHKPQRIIHTETYNTKSDALKREAQIKNWSRQEKITILNLSGVISPMK